MKILIIDDDEGTRTTLCRFLSSRGHVPGGAPGGQEGLRMVAEDPPDLVLCDIQMPGMDGLSFLRTARKQFPETPVVLMTGDRDVDHAVAAFRGGSLDYLKKPVNLEELLACLRKVEGLAKWA